MLSDILLAETGSPAHQLARHVARSKGSVKTYAEALVALVDSGAPGPIVEKHSRHAARLMAMVLEGKPQEREASALLQALREEVDEAEYDPKFSFAISRGSHKRFVKALEDKFNVEVHHFDEIGTGVYVYLDPENTDDLRAALCDTKVIFDELVGDLGYILLRRGGKEDMDYGHFGDTLSKWIFAQCIRPDENAQDFDGKVYSKQALARLERRLKEAYGRRPGGTVSRGTWSLDEREVEYEGVPYLVTASVHWHAKDDSDMNPETGYGPLTAVEADEVELGPVFELRGGERLRQVLPDEPVFNDLVEVVREMALEEIDVERDGDSDPPHDW